MHGWTGTTLDSDGTYSQYSDLDSLATMLRVLIRGQHWAANSQEFLDSMAGRHHTALDLRQHAYLQP